MDETPLQEPVSVFGEDEVGHMLAGIKDYLREAAKAHTVPQDQDHPLRDGVYTVSESDVQGLLYYILELADQLRKKGRAQSIITTATEAESSSSQAPRSMRPVASTTVDPATTITISEASFTPAVDTDEGGRQRAQAATTTTVISQDNVTEITWLHPGDSAPTIDAEAETTFGSPSPGSPSSTDQSKNAETTRTLDHLASPYSERLTSVDSRYGVTIDYRPGSSIARKRRQSSMVVFTNGDELDSEGGPGSGEGSDQPTTVLGKMRKKSVQFGQAMGSFMNGAYRNTDHKPRRDSSECVIWISKGRLCANDVCKRCCAHERHPRQNPAVHAQTRRRRPRYLHGLHGCTAHYSHRPVQCSYEKT